MNSGSIRGPIFFIFSHLLHHSFKCGFSIDVPLVVQPSRNGVVNEFSIPLHTDIGTLPKLASLVFEQNYNFVLRSKSRFYPFCKIRWCIISTPSCAVDPCIDFLIVLATIGSTLEAVWRSIQHFVATDLCSMFDGLFDRVCAKMVPPRHT